MTDNTRPNRTAGSSNSAGGADAREKGGVGGENGAGGGQQRPKRRRRRRRGRGNRSGSNHSNHSNQNQQGQNKEQHNQHSSHGASEAGEGRGGQGGKRRRNRNRSGAKGGSNNRNQSGKHPARRKRGRGQGSNRRQSQYSHRSQSGMETRDETSAGGLVVSGMAEAVNPENNKVDMSQIYVALIGRLDRRRRLLWSMPKGHVEDGEHQWRTAEREVWEETGIIGEAFDTLGTIDYWFVSDGVRIHKTVHHNLLRYVDGILNDEDPEVTEVAWVPMSELIERLAYADERKLARVAYDKMPNLARAEAEAGRATPR